MRRIVASIISVVFTFIKLIVLKLLYPNNLYFSFVERFSPSVVINVDKKSQFRVGKRVSIHSRGRFSSSSGGNLIIHDNCSFNVGCIVVCRNKIEIEENVTCGPNVMIYDHNHSIKADNLIKNTGYTLDSVSIGSNSWIGAGVIILAGTKIGRNCVIAAGSVVNGNVPDNTILIQKKESILKYVK